MVQSHPATAHNPRFWQLRKRCLLVSSATVLMCDTAGCRLRAEVAPCGSCIPRLILRPGRTTGAGCLLVGLHAFVPVVLLKHYRPKTCQPF